MVLHLLRNEKSYRKIEYPQSIMYAHTSFKGIQLGMIFGSIVGLIAAGYRRIKLKKTFKYKKIIKYMVRGMPVGFLLINTLAFRRMSNSTLEKNQSRAFRVCKNYGQNRADYLFFIGMLSGHFIFNFLPGASAITFGKAALGGLCGLIFDIPFMIMDLRK